MLKATNFNFGEETDAASPKLAWPAKNLQMWIPRERVSPIFVEARALRDHVQTTSGHGEANNLESTTPVDNQFASMTCLNSRRCSTSTKGPFCEGVDVGQTGAWREDSGLGFLAVDGLAVISQTSDSVWSACFVRLPIQDASSHRGAMNLCSCVRKGGDGGGLFETSSGSSTAPVVRRGRFGDWGGAAVAAQPMLGVCAFVASISQGVRRYLEYKGRAWPARSLMNRTFNVGAQRSRRRFWPMLDVPARCAGSGRPARRHRCRTSEPSSTSAPWAPILRRLRG